MINNIGIGNWKLLIGKIWARQRLVATIASFFILIAEKYCVHIARDFPNLFAKFTKQWYVAAYSQ